jgi:hypothetical protein
LSTLHLVSVPKAEVRQWAPDRPSIPQSSSQVNSWLARLRLCVLWASVVNCLSFAVFATFAFMHLNGPSGRGLDPRWRFGLCPLSFLRPWLASAGLCVLSGEVGGSAMEGRRGGRGAVCGRRVAAHGRCEAMHGRREAAHGSCEAAHGRREAAHGRCEAAHGRREAAHGRCEAVCGRRATPDIRGGGRFRGRGGGFGGLCAGARPPRVPGSRRAGRG